VVGALGCCCPLAVGQGFYLDAYAEDAQDDGPGILGRIQGVGERDVNDPPVA